MNRFKFKGDYQDSIESKFFYKLSSDKFFKFESLKQHQKELINGRIKLHITDERTVEYDPAVEQLTAINYFLENEEEIYNQVYKLVKEKILPKEQTHYNTDDYDEEELNWWFPNLNSVEGLKEVIGFRTLRIDILYRNKIALTYLDFEFSADEEHGLTIVFEGNKFLDYGPFGGFDPKNMLTVNEYEEYISNLNRKHPLQIWEPQNKYGKLKDWQIRANKYYPFGLIYEDRREDLTEYLINNKTIAISQIDELIKNAEWHKRTEVKKELIRLKKEEL